MGVSFQRAVVVGASSGIGEAIARRLVKEGATVVLVGRRREELERVAGSLPKGKAHVLEHDVRAFQSVPGAFERAVELLGGLDTLVYAAGVMPPIAEHEYDPEKDRAMVETNLLGAMAWMGPAAARFEAARAGTLVGISSIAGERGRRGNPGYTTSKAAMSAYLEALRNRCSRYGVNVVTAKPGFVDTVMTKGMKSPLWLVSADDAARMTLALARKGSSANGFVPARWALIAWIVRSIPSWLFRKTNV